MQLDPRIRLEQGLTGALAVARGPDLLIVVVDVLSFSTTVVVAAEHGVAIVPVRSSDAHADEVARRHRAVLAGRRGASGPTLSPASFLRLEAIERVAIPSPNGATLAVELAPRGRVLAGCLRNASAVGRACSRHLERSDAAAVAVIAAGERHHDGSLRSALEDVWGAGAVMRAIGRPDLASPEALDAIDAFDAALQRDLPLADLTSGGELIDAGFAEDVRIAAQVDVSAAVPALLDGSFR